MEIIAKFFDFMLLPALAIGIYAILQSLEEIKDILKDARDKIVNVN
tara:strand:- start:990 stop:1127 length:138 start_codon:yes stop_codon:yes gene_type:complete